MKIYTKNGDYGKSLSPFGLIDKGSIYFKVLGGIDEIMASIGIIMNGIDTKVMSNINVELNEITSNLKLILDDLWYNDTLKQRFDIRSVELLERWIDEKSEILTPIKGFIKPLGNKTSLQVNLTRCIVRRVECDYFDMLSTMKMDLDGGKYLNRLSDYLFTLYRYVNKICLIEEVY